MEPLIRDPRLRKLTFTGSTEVGKKLVEQSAEQLLRVSMELGGNAPFLVFDDADLDAAVDGAMLAKMRNMGEACTAANRFLVHESVADEFAARLAERMGALKVGRGTEDGVDVGPLVDAGRARRSPSWSQDAVDAGARVLIGGDAVGDRGYFYAPTVLADVAPRRRGCCARRSSARSPRSSTFADRRGGPAAGQRHRVRPRRLRLHPDLTRALRVVEGLESGMVGLNAGHRLQPGGAVRRRQAVRLRPRGRRRGHRGVPRDQVRRHRPLTVPSPADHANRPIMVAMIGPHAKGVRRRGWRRVVHRLRLGPR